MASVSYLIPIEKVSQLEIIKKEKIESIVGNMCPPVDAFWHASVAAGGSWREIYAPVDAQDIEQAHRRNQEIVRNQMENQSVIEYAHLLP